MQFPVMQKVDVNGDAESPIFTYLKKEQKGIFNTEGIKWNFTKFLVNKKGEVVGRFAPATKPEEIESEIV